MNYEDKTDLQIECLVSAEKWKEKCLSKKHWNNTAQRTYREIQEGTCVYADARYCSNPSDAQSIILETCMTIELAHPELGGVGTNTIYNPRGTDWQCDYEDNEQWLRAAMICYLEMKESENG